MSLNTTYPKISSPIPKFGKLLQLFSILPYLFLALGPMVALLLDVGNTTLAGQSDWLDLVIPKGRRLALFFRSIGLASGVAAGGTLLGICIGTVLWQWRRGPASYLRWFLIVLAPIPPYLHALGWSSFILLINSILDAWGLPAIAMRGVAASIWVQIMATVPLAIGLTLVGFESINPDLVDASRLHRRDMDGFLKVILPLAAPIILAGGSFLFLLSLIDYSVPSLFQISTYSLEIFAEFSASNQPSRAFLLSIPLLFIALVTISLSQLILRKATILPAWKSRIWEVPPSWPRAFKTLQATAMILLIGQILVPIISQTLVAGSIENISSTLQAAQTEIRASWWIAVFAVLISIPIAIPIAQRLVENRLLWWGLVAIPLAIPSPLIGIGLIAIWNHPPTHAIYASLLMPVFASIARFAPMAVILIFTQLRRHDPALLDAARVLQKNNLHTWLKVRIPLLIPSLFATAGLVFVLTVGELGASLLVAPPGQATLTMRIYNFLHYGASDMVAGLGLVMTLAIMGFGGLAAFLLAGWTSSSSRSAS